MASVVPRNKRDAIELTAQTYSTAATLLRAWAASGATTEQCIDRLEHHAWAIRTTNR